jgi:muramoyltetrapeptide carboxypeptidase
VQGAALNWTRPPALRPGDRVGVCAPAGSVDLERLERGISTLRELGLEVVVGDAVRSRFRFTAGTVDERVRDLQTLWADDSVRGIVCARGGSGAGWLLPRLNVESMVARPKVFMGYSDITFLHSLLNSHGLVTFHGPMVAVASDLADRRYDEASLRAGLLGEGEPYRTGPGGMRALRAGAGEGRLQGGCISILAAAAGTPWAIRPDTEGTILFLEDQKEPPYRIDRALMQLRASGALAGARGIVFGAMKECSPSHGAGYTLADVMLDALAGLDIPIAIGLSSGHTNKPNVTLPFGVRARLTCSSPATGGSGGDEARLEILEASVA